MYIILSVFVVFDLGMFIPIFDDLFAYFTEII